MTNNAYPIYYEKPLNTNDNTNDYSTGNKEITSLSTQTDICNTDFSTGYIINNTMSNVDYIKQFYQSKTATPQNCSVKIVRNLNRNNLFEKKKSSLGTKSSKKQEGYMLFKKEYLKSNVLLEKEESEIEDKCIRMWKGLDKDMKRLYCQNAESIKKKTSTNEVDEKTGI